MKPFPCTPPNSRCNMTIELSPQSIKDPLVSEPNTVPRSHGTHAYAKTQCREKPYLQRT